MIDALGHARPGPEGIGDLGAALHLQHAVTDAHGVTRKRGVCFGGVAADLGHDAKEADQDVGADPRV